MADPVYDGIDVITVSSPLSWRPPSCFFLPSLCRCGPDDAAALELKFRDARGKFDEDRYRNRDTVCCRSHGRFALIALDPKCGGFVYEFEFNRVPPALR